jgi:hypothetical protein
MWLAGLLTGPFEEILRLSKAPRTHDAETHS